MPWDSTNAAQERRHQRSWYIAWAMLALVTIGLLFGLRVLTNNQHTADKHNREQTYAVCKLGHDNRRLLIQLVGPAPQQFPIPAGADPALAEAINNANANAVKNHEQSLKILGDDPPKCHKP